MIQIQQDAKEAEHPLAVYMPEVYLGRPGSRVSNRIKMNESVAFFHCKCDFVTLYIFPGAVQTACWVP